MPFDMSFNFRSTAGYVTDGSEGVPVLNEAYPHTYTNGDGKSLNAGWGAIGQVVNRFATNDPRIAGANGPWGGSAGLFTIDLSSGSNPGAGDYAIDLAAGDPQWAAWEAFNVKDNTTTLISKARTLTNDGGYFFDATGTLVGPVSSNWTGTTVTKTFASTTCNIEVNPSATADVMWIAHFRLTLQGGGPTAKPWAHYAHQMAA